MVAIKVLTVWFVANRCLIWNSSPIDMNVMAGEKGYLYTLLYATIVNDLSF